MLKAQAVRSLTEFPSAKLCNVLNENYSRTKEFSNYIHKALIAEWVRAVSTLRVSTF